MKRYLIWFLLMMKRMMKKPAFVIFLLCLPVLAAGIERLEENGAGGAVIGIVVDDIKKSETWSAGRENVLSGRDEDAACGAWMQALLSLLTEQESVLQGGTLQSSIFQFRIYDKETLLVQDVKRGELDCGVVLPGDMWDKMQAEEWREAITLYETASGGMSGIVKEKIASALFTVFSEESYGDYIENSGAFAAAVAGGIAREEIVSFARDAYETHLLDGSTFAFQYHGESYTGKNDDGDAVAEASTVTQTFRLRGVLAVCIFLSGLCGLLTDWQDRQEKRFVRMAPAWMTTMVNIWIPTICTSAIALFCLILTGQSAGSSAGVWADAGMELCRLFFYQFLIVLYCSIIRLIIRKQETIAAAVPLFTLASMVCCPVWIRLAVYLPIFRVLEKLFPVTYYLLL